MGCLPDNQVLSSSILVNNFWSGIGSDTQTRSMLPTDQQLPSVSSQNKKLQVNKDGSMDVVCGPRAPAGKESNGVQTVPGKNWFPILRHYGPLEPWFNRTWKPGEHRTREVNRAYPGAPTSPAGVEVGTEPVSTATREMITMIERLPGGSEKVLGFRISGKLHDEDYKTFVPLIDDAIAKEGKVRLLAQFHDFHGWDLHALWDDIKFSTTHCTKIERIALVGDKAWEKWMSKVCKPFTMAKIRYFDAAEINAAWAWLDEA